jgi:general secretion pathway protein G
MRTGFRRGFTLVEILIVVVILGILASIVVVMFKSTVDESAISTTHWELQKLRRHVGMFRARNDGRYPTVEEGNGTWGELVSRDYMMAPPINAWAGRSQAIVFGAGPDNAYQTDYGWIYDPATGEVWAGAFDVDDEAIPRN